MFWLMQHDVDGNVVTPGGDLFDAALRAIVGFNAYLVKGAADANIRKKAAVQGRGDVPLIHGRFDEHVGAIHVITLLVDDQAVYSMASV